MRSPLLMDDARRSQGLDGFRQQKRMLSHRRFSASSRLRVVRIASQSPAEGGLRKSLLNVSVVRVKISRGSIQDPDLSANPLILLLQRNCVWGEDIRPIRWSSVEELRRIGGWTFATTSGLFPWITAVSLVDQDTCMFITHVRITFLWNYYTRIPIPLIIVMRILSTSKWPRRLDST